MKNLETKNPSGKPNTLEFSSMPKGIQLLIAIILMCLVGAGYSFAKHGFLSHQNSQSESISQNEALGQDGRETEPGDHQDSDGDSGDSSSTTGEKDGDDSGSADSSEVDSANGGNSNNSGKNTNGGANNNTNGGANNNTNGNNSTSSSSATTNPAAPSVVDTPAKTTDPIVSVSPRPYYYMLTAAERTVYNQFVSNANVLNDSFAPDELLTSSEIERVIEAVHADHPELFWLEPMINYEYASSGTVTKVLIPYNDLSYDLASNRATFNSRANAIINAASQLPTHLERERYVHDTLIKNNIYDQSANNNQSAYSAIVTGRTVCAGFSRAFQYLMNRLGVTTYFVTGVASGDEHAWNIVYLDGRYYNVDLTWDSAKHTSGYFNAADGLMTTHRRTGLSVNLPRCS